MVTVTQKWYATHCHPKMHSHTKFGIPTPKNIGDMDRTRKQDGHTDGRTDSAITICLPKFLWGHKKHGKVNIHNQVQMEYISEYSNYINKYKYGNIINITFYKFSSNVYKIPATGMTRSHEMKCTLIQLFLAEP